MPKVKLIIMFLPTIGNLSPAPSGGLHLLARNLPTMLVGLRLASHIPGKFPLINVPDDCRHYQTLATRLRAKCAVRFD